MRYHRFFLAALLSYSITTLSIPNPVSGATNFIRVFGPGISLACLAGPEIIRRIAPDNLERELAAIIQNGQRHRTAMPLLSIIGACYFIGITTGLTTGAVLIGDFIHKKRNEKFLDTFLKVKQKFNNKRIHDIKQMIPESLSNYKQIMEDLDTLLI